PASKLSSLPGLAALVGTVESTVGTHQTIDQAQELLNANVDPTAAIRRGEWVDPSDAAGLIGQAVALHPAGLDPEDDARVLKGMPWGLGSQPTGYRMILSRWLAGEAVAAYQSGDHHAASWLAQQSLEAGGVA